MTSELRHQSRRGRPAGLGQVPGAGDEVGERVLLVQQLAVGVPGPAHLAAAPDVRDRVDETAVEQGQHGDGEGRVAGELVAAVAVQQARRAAVARRALAADQRDRDPGAVEGHRPLPVLLVVIGPVGDAGRGGEYRLKKIFAAIEALGRYDVILVDCPPSLGILTDNALVAAGQVLVPAQSLDSSTALTSGTRCFLRSSSITWR